LQYIKAGLIETGFVLMMYTYKQKEKLSRHADFLYSNGILSSKDEQIYWIFSDNRMISYFGYIQLIMVFLKYLAQTVIGRVTMPYISEYSTANENAKVCIIWPDATWGGFQEKFIPSSLSKKEYNVLTWTAESKYLLAAETIMKLYLALILLRYILQIEKTKDKLAFFVWSFSNQPLYLMKSRELFEAQKTLKLSVLETIYFPFEFYPEARLVYSFAADHNLNSAVAQHMKWTVKKLSNFSSKNLGIHLPRTFYISKAQKEDLFNDFACEVITDRRVGRFDLLLEKENKILTDSNMNFIQILCSGTPYDVMRSVEFAKRTKKSNIETLLVFHPSTSKTLLFITKYICALHNLKTQIGFTGHVSPVLPIFTCGTSLFTSLSRAGLRVKDIGGEASQF